MKSQHTKNGGVETELFNKPWDYLPLDLYLGKKEMSLYFKLPIGGFLRFYVENIHNYYIH